MHINEGNGIVAGFGDALIADEPVVVVGGFECEDGIDQFSFVHMDFLFGRVLRIGKNTAGDFSEDLVIPGKGNTVILLQVERVQLGAADKGFFHGFRRYHLPVEDSAHVQVPLRGCGPGR